MARQLTGVVSSDKGEKTIVITVRVRRTHPLYKKQYTVNTKFMAHDEKNEAKPGDLVTIIETRPISARKHFKLSKIIEHAGASFTEADATADIPEETLEPTVQKPTPKAKPKAELKPEAEAVEPKKEAK